MKIKGVVEMPKDTHYKYEIKEGVLTIDRVLNRKVPFNYGFIPDTKAQDGDALDVFLVSHEPIQAGTLVSAEVVGGFDCLDNGVPDEKLVAVVGGESFPFMMELVRDYLQNYKEGFQVLCEISAQNAMDLVTQYAESEEASEPSRCAACPGPEGGCCR